MSVELLTEHHLEFLSLKGGGTGSSEYTLVKMPHCWKSHVAAHLVMNNFYKILPVLSGEFVFVWVIVCCCARCV